MKRVRLILGRSVPAVLIGLGLVISPCFAAEKAAEAKKPTDQKEKESYSFGYQFGDYLKKQKLDLDLDIYVSAIKDALAGKEPLMDAQEMRATVTEIQKRVMMARQAEMKEQAEKNLAASKAFLEENKKKEGVKVTASGLQYKVLKEGTGKTPKVGDTVTVNYKGTLIDGTEFDSSFKRNEPAKFKVGSVIKGWTEALQMMKEGAKWELFIPPDLAYGERGGPTIGPNSALIFEVELISVEEGQPPAAQQAPQGAGGQSGQANQPAQHDQGGQAAKPGKLKGEKPAKPDVAKPNQPAKPDQPTKPAQ